VVTALQSAAANPTPENLRILLAAVSSESAISYLDGVMQQLSGLPIEPANFHEIARWLTVTGIGRDAVKCGIALLCLSGLHDDDYQILKTLALHDEFTLFVVIGILNTFEPSAAEKAIFEIAQQVTGWGSIHCVEHLKETSNPEIQDWILRKGFHSIMDEYLAYIAATTGNLVQVLRGDPDREQLTAAGDILTALIDGGPAEDIADYEDGAAAIGLFLDQITSRNQADLTLSDFLNVAQVHDFVLDTETPDWEHLFTIGWTTELRASLAEQSQVVLNSPQWPETIHNDLKSTDDKQFWPAAQATDVLGIDTFNLFVSRLKADPLGSDWHHAWQHADTETRVIYLAALAEELIPLHEIATGSENAMGFGKRFRAHGALNWSLQELRSHPGIGSALLMAALHSPSNQNRMQALNALGSWPRNVWPNQAEDILT